MSEISLAPEAAEHLPQPRAYTGLLAWVGSVDHKQIEASIAAAEASIERAHQEIEQLEIRYQDDE